jgi:hypothetical protein
MEVIVPDRHADYWLASIPVIGPIPLHCQLRTGAIWKKSKELLKSNVVRAEVYNHFSRLCSQ